MFIKCTFFARKCFILDYLHCKNKEIIKSLRFIAQLDFSMFKEKLPQNIAFRKAEFIRNLKIYPVSAYDNKSVMCEPYNLSFKTSKIIRRRQNLGNNLELYNALLWAYRQYLIYFFYFKGLKFLPCIQGKFLPNKVH